MYTRRVVKRRPASLTEAEWSKLLSARFVDPGYFRDRDGREGHQVDVNTLLFQSELTKLRWRLEALCMALSKPHAGVTEVGSSSLSLSPGQLLSGFAEIWDFLTKPSYHDGTARLLGKVSLACCSGGLQVTLTDQSSNCYCCVTAKTLDDAFLALEVGLKDDSLPWRASSYNKSKK